MTIRFAPRRITVMLATIVSGLIVADLFGLVSRYVFGHGRLLGLVPLFDLDREANIPTYFAALLLLLCSALLLLIGGLKAERKDPLRRYWQALGLIFLYLSVDEAATLHETFVTPLRTLFHTSGVLYFAWVIPYGIGGFILLVIFLRFLLHLPPTMRRLTILAGSVYVTGALGFELLAGYYVDRLGGRDVFYALLATGEESLEMIGLVIFGYALMTYLESESGQFQVRFQSQTRTVPPSPGASSDSAPREAGQA
jgi:hypothetical protein